MLRFLLLSLALGLQFALSAQPWSRPPLLDLLGTDLYAIGDAGNGLLAYDGLGKLDRLQTLDYLAKQRTDFTFVPARGWINGFGQLAPATFAKGLQITNGADRLQAQLGYDHQWRRTNQSLQFRGYRNQDDRDRNEDGFLDRPQVRHYVLRHRLMTSFRDWWLNTSLNYLKRQSEGGQLAYRWPENQGSKEIYGFGREVTQRAAGLQVGRNFSERLSLRFRLHTRDHLETGTYGRRDLRGFEDRLGAAGMLLWKKELHESRVAASWQRRQLEQHWDGLPIRRRFTQIKLAVHHQRFLSENWLLRIGTQLDRHTRLGWQLLPNLRLDYTGWGEHRIGLVAGRDYRFSNELEELQPYFQSQRQWRIESLGADRLWFTGLSGKSATYSFFEAEQQFKLVYLTRHYDQLQRNDPSRKGIVTTYVLRKKIPLQHLLLATLKTTWRNWRTALVYRYSDASAPLIDGSDRQLLDARHGLLTTVAYQNGMTDWRLYNWQVRTDYLLRSLLDLPNGTTSTVLHDWRLHAEVGRVIRRGRPHRLSIYGGLVNLLNQTQDTPYTQAATPFTAGFDGSSAWGDPVGRQGYVGVKWRW